MRNEGTNTDTFISSAEEVMKQNNSRAFRVYIAKQEANKNITSNKYNKERYHE